jgi:hypothetical protein
VDSSQTAFFAVTAYGSPPLWYQWSLNGQPLAGQTNEVLNLPSATTNNAGNYTVMVFNNFGVTNSGMALLTVVVPPSSEGPIRPWIISESTNQTVGSRQSAQFHVEASGTGPLSYQWFFNGSPRSGANSASLVLPSVSTNDSGTYSALVSSPYGSITSSPMFLGVGVPPSISTPPLDRTVTNGQVASFNTSAFGDAPLAYQWLFNGTNLLTDDGSNISGSATSTLIVSNSGPANQGSYAVVASNAYGLATSSSANLTVLVPIPPSISTQPADFTVTNGQAASFSIAALSAAPLEYRWFFNSTNALTDDGSNIFGSASATLTISNTSPGNQGGYAVVVGNAYGLTISSNANLIVLVPPSIIQQPQDQAVAVGDSATFAVTANGTAPLVYQWLFNGTNLPGAAAVPLTLGNVTLNNAGTYAVVVTNSVGSTTSSSAVLTIYPTAAAELNSPSISTSQFQFIVSGVPGYSYAVQSSTNLIDWTSFETNTAPFFFEDTNGLASPYLFYRVVHPRQ